MKKKSARIKELQELIREGENYQRLKPVHTELNNIKFKKQREKFETSHDAELRLFYAARRILKEKLDGKPIALESMETGIRTVKNRVCRTVSAAQATWRKSYGYGRCRTP